jgi:hypothetical protein
LKLTIDSTPIPGAPIKIDSNIFTTDSKGEISRGLWTTHFYTIESPLDAIAFSPRYGTGTALSSLGSVALQGSRRVQAAGPACKMLVGGNPQIYFSTLNTSARTITIPAEYPDLNSVYSRTGTTTPLRSFPAGTGGFAVPYSDFSFPTGIYGLWTFLGQEIAVTNNLPICSDSMVADQCHRLTPAIFQAPIDETRLTLQTITNLALGAAKSGRWKPSGSGGVFAIPFLKNGAKALAQMSKILDITNTQARFVCSTPSTSCRAVIIPKKALENAFLLIFKGKIPAGLQFIVSRQKRELAAFRKTLADLPNSYIICD